MFIFVQGSCCPQVDKIGYEKDKITTNTFVPLGGDGACIGTVGDDYQGYERGADGICVSHVQE